MFLLDTGIQDVPKEGCSENRAVILLEVVLVALQTIRLLLWLRYFSAMLFFEGFAVNAALGSASIV